MRQVINLACLTLLLVCAACSGASTGTTSGDVLPTGDTTRGAALFSQAINGAPSCSTCHTLDGSTLVGPSLKGFAAVASTRVEGMSAADYAHTSIVQPTAYLVSGFANLMYGQYAQQLTPQQTADLVAYLLTL
ncbi:MAG: cytochrome c [Anaerolineae bacterium]|nr:cytochrome c [Anaerolineae bacterium]